MKIKITYKSAIHKNRFFKAWVSEKSCIEPVFRIESEARPGGKYRLYSGDPENPALISGDFIQFREADYLEYSWQWQGSGEKTKVSVSFYDINGGTLIELEHSTFESKESYEGHLLAWKDYFKKLEQLILEEDFSDRKSGT